MKIKLQISSSIADSKNKPHVAWGAYEIMVATNAVLRHDFTNLRNFALLSARCIYLLIFKKSKANQSVFASRPLPFLSEPVRMKMLIFQPPNILTPSESGRRGLEK